jgi:hypothetical protein
MSNVYVCGHGLGITRFLLQGASGSSWQGATRYEKNNRYRFRAKFQNYFPSGTPSNNEGCAKFGIHIVDLQIKVRLEGAIFDYWGPNSGAFALMPRQINGHPDFNDTIAPQASRWFEFGAFKWATSSASASSVPVQIQTLHRFVAHNPYPGWGNVLATSA